MPFSQGELRENNERFVESLFALQLDAESFSFDFEENLPELIVKGGFSENHRLYCCGTSETDDLVRNERLCLPFPNDHRAGSRCRAEDSQGRLVAIEIKSAASVGRKDFQGIEPFAETVGDKFYRGVVLYAGNQGVSFSERLLALPISSVWQ